MVDLTIAKDAPRIVHDMWDAILGDSWMNIVIWGKPRTGKTTCQMKLAFAVLNDWDLVLQSFVYNLCDILVHIKKGVPIRYLTKNGLHNRVPFILPDDWGAHGNKAKTQHEPAMDIFKGAMDVYGTKVSIFMSSMGNPNALTQQLQEKYTHEIFVPEKGLAKYDAIDWQQNFAGWQPRRKKAWQDTFTFDEVPISIYKKYDENRMALVDEMDQLIEDAMVDSESYRLLKRLDKLDIELLTKLRDDGMIHKDWFKKKENQKFGEILKRCKARSLIIPLVKPGTEQYYYDATDFGLEVLKISEQRKE
jgi:hypothetical protein